MFSKVVHLPWPCYVIWCVPAITHSVRAVRRSHEESRDKWPVTGNACKGCQCAYKILAQQLVKGMSRTVPVQQFPRPIVEQRLHALDLPRDS